MTTTQLSGNSPLVIFGAGGQAANVFEVATTLNTPIIGFVDESYGANEAFTYLDLPVFRSIQEATRTLASASLVVALGEGWSREQETRRALEQSVCPIGLSTLIHPSAVVSHSAYIGGGSVVMPGVFVGPNATLGEGVIVGANSVIGHDCEVRDYSSIYASVTLGGKVTLGHRTAIGMNSVVQEKTRVGSDVVVGAQSLVRQDVEDRCVIVGSPARKVKDRLPGDNYLR